jgi:organic radical activating enzyme
MWRRLLDEELKCTRMASKAGVETFVKIVVLPSTKASTISRVCRAVPSGVPVVLQPVTPTKKVKTCPNMTHVYRLAEVAARAGVEVAIIPQVHKLLGIP